MIDIEVRAKPSIIIILLLVFLTIFSPTVSAKTIQLPIEKINKIIDIKINQKYQMTEPSFKFRDVQKREVKEATAESLKPFPSCGVTSSQIEFTIHDKIKFKDAPEKPLLIYDFEDIEYSQFFLDFYFESNQIFMMFQDGMVAYIKLAPDDLIQSNHVFKVVGLHEDEKLSIGYFAKIQNTIVFMNQRHIIKVNRNSATVLDGYQQIRMFQSVTAVQQKYLVGVYSSFGIYVFQLDGKNGVKIVDNITQSLRYNRRKNSFVDILYDKGKQALLVLDKFNGIVKIDIDLKTGKLNPSNDLAYDKKYCSLMTVNQLTQTLHIVCENVYELGLDKWPQLYEMNNNTFPYIEIRQVFCLGYLTFFIGRDTFSVMHWGKVVSFYEGDNMDRLIITPDIFMSANQDSLTIGKYNINQPQVQCTITQPELEGDHTLIFETVAECNEEYYATRKISRKTYQFSQNDICKYTTHLPIYVWIPGQILNIPIITAIIVFLIIGLLVLSLAIYQKYSLGHIQTEYETITSASSHHLGQSQKPMQLNEEYEKYVDTHDFIIKKQQKQHQQQLQKEDPK